MYEQEREIPFLIYILTSIAVFATGLIYLFPSQFIPCGQEITSKKWNELSPSLPMLPLTLTKGIGVTLIGVGVALCFLRCYHFNKKYLDLSLPIAQLILLVSLIYVDINVIQTLGSVPWYVFSLNGVLIFITSALSIYYPNKSIGSGCSF